MSTNFTVDQDRLRANAVIAGEYAAKLRAFIEEYDSPDYYEKLARATGLANAADVEALKAHGAAMRKDTELLAARYEAIAQGSLESIKDTTSADDNAATGITTATREL